MISPDLENIDKEVNFKELLQEFKFQTAQYKTCTIQNFKECLIGLSEELSLLNIEYIFNPHTDVENDNLHLEALVKLINSVYTLLYHHKNSMDKVENLEEQNYLLDNSNKELNVVVGSLKEKLNSEKNESKACVATPSHITDLCDKIHQELLKTTAIIQNNIDSFKLEKNRIGKSESRDRLMQIKERPKKIRALIAQQPQKQTIKNYYKK